RGLFSLHLSSLRPEPPKQSRRLISVGICITGVEHNEADPLRQLLLPSGCRGQRCWVRLLKAICFMPECYADLFDQFTVHAYQLGEPATRQFQGQYAVELAVQGSVRSRHGLALRTHHCFALSATDIQLAAMRGAYEDAVEQSGTGFAIAILGLATCVAF